MQQGGRTCPHAARRMHPMAPPGCSCPPSRSTSSHRRLEAFMRERTLPTGEPVTSEWALDVSGKDTSPVRGTYGTGSRLDAIPQIVDRTQQADGLCRLLPVRCGPRRRPALRRQAH